MLRRAPDAGTGGRGLSAKMIAVVLRFVLILSSRSGT